METDEVSTLNIKNKIKLILSLPKSIYFNFKVLPADQAVKLPVLVSYDTELRSLQAKVNINCPVKYGMITIGMANGSFNIGSCRKSMLDLKKGGIWNFSGKAVLAKGVCVSIGENAEFSVGPNFIGNANFLCSCSKKITFGSNSMVGWSCSVIDGDGHPIMSCDKPDVQINSPREIIIGDSVWLASNVSVLKGTVISDATVVAYGTTISGKYDQTNVIIGGEKAKVIKNNIMFRY